MTIRWNLWQLGLALVWAGSALAGYPDCEAFLKPVPGHTERAPGVIRRLDTDRRVLGYLTYGFKRGQTLRIDTMGVHPEVRRQGVSRLLMAEALAENPAALRIETTLAWTNAQVFFDALRALPFKEKLLHPRRASQVAVLSTPFYRTASVLGFSRILKVSPREEVVDLVLEKQP